MTQADRALIIVIAVLALLSGPVAVVASGQASAATLIIEGPTGRTEVSLGVDRTLVVAGLRGRVVVEVVDGSVLVTSADCPDHVCVHTGAISRPGSAIVCVPNAVTVRVGGARDDGLDAVVR